MNKKTFAKALANLLFFLLFAWLFTSISSWQQLSRVLSQLPVHYALLGFLALMTTYVLRTHRFYVLLAQPDIKWRTVFKIMLQHNAINNLLPFRLGELSFPLLLKKHANLSLLSSGKVLVTARLFDLLIMGALSAIIVLYFMSRSIPGAVFPSIAVALLFLVAFYFLLQSAKLPFARQVQAYISYLSGHLRQAGSLSLLIWLFKVLGLAFLLVPMLNTDLLLALVAVLVVEGTAILPINGPANFGSLEGISLAVLVPLGLEANAVFAAILNLHLAIIMLAALGYLISLFIPSVKQP